MAAGCAVFIFYLVLTGNEDRIAGRLADLSANSPAATPNRSTRPAVAGMIPRLGQSRTAREVDEKEERNTLRGRIVQAGLYKPQAMAIFTTIRIAFCVSPVVMGIMASSVGLVSRNQGLIFGLIAGVMGTIAPSLYLDRLKRSRQTKIRRSLPDALDVIIVCLEGGLSVPASLSRVAAELATAHPMLAHELQIVEREIQMGRSPGEAMRQFAQRFDLEELRSLSSVIIQAEQFGTSVTKAFNVYAEGMRIKRHQRAEEKAQRAIIYILFPTLLCIFPGIFIVLLGPAAIMIYKAIILGFRNGTL
jgi:tight adherence protein C